MGRQIRFYMLQKDEINFLKQLLKIDGLYFVRKKFSDPLTMYVDPLRCHSQNSIECRNLFICSPNTILNKKNILKRKYIVNKSFTDGFDKQEEYFMIDEDNANVIEFSRCLFNPEGKLVQGRLWVELYAMRANRYIYKGEELKNLYNRISNWIRHNFNKIEGQDGYFGPEAENKYINGTLLLFP